jgi:hypothetical protein
MAICTLHSVSKRHTKAHTISVSAVLALHVALLTLNISIWSCTYGQLPIGTSMGPCPATLKYTTSVTIHRVFPNSSYRFLASALVSVFHSAVTLLRTPLILLAYAMTFAPAALLGTFLILITILNFMSGILIGNQTLQLLKLRMPSTLLNVKLQHCFNATSPQPPTSITSHHLTSMD